MTAAIFGLFGVIVGALVTAGIDYWRTQRAARDEKKAAIRLVLLEITTLRQLIGAVEIETGETLERAIDSLAAYFPVPPAWREHRGTLAKLLPADDWTTVAKAMQRFEAEPWAKGFLSVPPWARQDPLEPSVAKWNRARWDSFHSRLADATNVMERHAEVQWSREPP